jgi:hypothetical protein
MRRVYGETRELARESTSITELHHAERAEVRRGTRRVEASLPTPGTMGDVDGEER